MKKLYLLYTTNKLVSAMMKLKTGNRMNRVKILVMIMLGSSLFPVLAQDSTLVKGRVMASNQEPLQNVSISIEGSSQLPVLTNENGEFQVKSTRGSDWIFVDPPNDFKTKRIYLNDRKSLNIYLTPADLDAGSDPVPIMSGYLPRRDVLISHTMVNTDEIAKTPAMTVDQYLQYRVPGMQVINKSGQPGSGAVMTLRGINSIYATNQPLIIVDGIPLAAQSDIFQSKIEGFVYNPLITVNPLDISKVVVIKDPVVTAAYGSRASNGIISIETLDPSATQTSIDIDYRNGFSLQPQRQIPQLNAGQHRTLISELLFSSILLEEEIVEEYPNLFLEPEDDRYVEYQHNTNWQNLVFDEALMTNFNIKVKGGDEIARYGLSFGYTDSKGIIRNSGYQGYNLRFVSMLNIFTWLKMDAGVSLNNSSSQLKAAGTVGETSPIMTSLSKSPMLHPYQYDLEGRPLLLIANVDELEVSNPLATIENYRATNSNVNFNARLGLTGTINNDMFVKSNFRFNYNVLKEGIYMPNKGMELYFNNEAYNVAKLSNNSLNSFYNNTYLNYTRQIGNNHSITSNTGVHVYTNNFQYDWGLGKNAHENDEYRMIQDGQNALREIGGENRTWNWLSFYEHATYAYRDRYIASASVSFDGSSRIGDDAANTIMVSSVPFGLFYAGGLAWRISNESFLTDFGWLEDLKLRVSYGKSGNDDIGESNATDYYQSVKIRETVGLYPATVPNTELTYETVTQTNAGVDLSLLGSKFTMRFDIFRSVTDDMIIFSPIESYLGYDQRIENNGRMMNSGWELSSFYRIVDRGNFNWDLNVYASSISNEVLEIRGDKMAYEIPGGERVNMVGETANSFFGYRYLGVYATQVDADNAGLVNEKLIPYKAGDAIYEDISGPGPDGAPDGIINDYDKTVIGSSLPEYFGGMINTFTYGRFSLSIALQFVYGNEIFNYIRYQNEKMSDLDNQSAAVLTRWQYDGHETNVPRALYDDPIGNSAFSSRWIEDGSYLRIKHASLSYTIPDKWLVFRNAQFYVSANNLLTFSKYLGYDPEFAFSNSQIHQGIDYGLTPISRQFIIGLRLGL